MNISRRMRIKFIPIVVKCLSRRYCFLRAAAHSLLTCQKSYGTKTLGQTASEPLPCLTLFWLRSFNAHSAKCPLQAVPPPFTQQLSKQNSRRMGRRGHQSQSPAKTCIQGGECFVERDLHPQPS